MAENVRHFLKVFIERQQTKISKKILTKNKKEFLKEIVSDFLNWIPKIEKSGNKYISRLRLIEVDAD